MTYKYFVLDKFGTEVDMDELGIFWHENQSYLWHELEFWDEPFSFKNGENKRVETRYVQYLDLDKGSYGFIVTNDSDNDKRITVHNFMNTMPVEEFLVRVSVIDRDNKQHHVTVFRSKNFKEALDWKRATEGDFTTFITNELGEILPGFRVVPVDTSRDTVSFEKYCVDRGMYQELRELPDNESDTMFCLHSSTDYGGDYYGEYLEAERQVSYMIMELALDLTENNEVPKGEAYELYRWTNRQSWINISQPVVNGFLDILKLVVEDAEYPLWADSPVDWFRAWLNDHKEDHPLYERVQQLKYPCDYVYQLQSEALHELIESEIRMTDDEREWTPEMVYDFLEKFRDGDYGKEAESWAYCIDETHWFDMDEMLEFLPNEQEGSDDTDS